MKTLITALMIGWEMTSPGSAATPGTTPAAGYPPLTGTVAPIKPWIDEIEQRAVKLAVEVRAKNPERLAAYQAFFEKEKRDWRMECVAEGFMLQMLVRTTGTKKISDSGYFDARGAVITIAKGHEPDLNGEVGLRVALAEINTVGTTGTEVDNSLISSSSITSLSMSPSPISSNDLGDPKKWGLRYLVVEQYQYAREENVGSKYYDAIRVDQKSPPPGPAMGMVSYIGGGGGDGKPYVFKTPGVNGGYVRDAEPDVLTLATPYLSVRIEVPAGMGEGARQDILKCMSTAAN